MHVNSTIGKIPEKIVNKIKIKNNIIGKVVI